MPKPHDPRTLRYCARVLLKERDALRSLVGRNGGTKAAESALRWRARQCEIHGVQFVREARSIDKLNKLPPKAERLAKTLCGTNRNKRARAIERKARK